MSAMSRFRSFAHRIVHHQRVDADLDDEIRSQLAMMTDQKIKEGMKPQEACRAAKIELGGVEQLKEQVREVRVAAWLDSFGQDVRFALRMLRKNPGFTTIAVLTLALGIGANTAIFSVVYGILFRPLPYHNPDQLVAVATTFPSDPTILGHVSALDFRDWESQNTVFQYLSSYGYNRYDLPDEQGGDTVRAAMVSPDFFPLLGVRPLFGRELGPQDDREYVAVLGYDIWQQVFHGDAAVIGKPLHMRDRDFEIVGVMPPSFRLPTPDVAVWLSFADIYATSGKGSIADWTGNRGLRGYSVIARLKNGVTVLQAQSQMNAIEGRLGRAYPDDDKGIGVRVTPLRTQIMGGVEDALLLLLGAVGLVLLIACVNVANLLLAKATVREREMAIRQVLGASLRRLIRQALTETALLGVIGAAFGVLLACWSVQIFLHIIPQNIPRLPDVHIDVTVMLFALAASLLASFFFGLAPALRLRGSGSLIAVHEGSRTTGSSGHHRTRALLVSGEIAAATILVAGAALMLQSFIRLATLQPGFDPGHLLTFEVAASLDRYSQPWQEAAFFNQVLEKIRALPGVRAAGACTSMPPDISQETDPFSIQDRTPLGANKAPSAWYLPATPGFLGALGIPLVAGRDFNDADTADAPNVAIINQLVATQYFARQNPVGQRIRFRGVDRTIVGVAGDATYSGVGAPADFQIYVPYVQGTFPGLHFAVRATGDPLALVASVRSALREVDPQEHATRVSTMDDLLSESIVQPRFYAWLMVAFGFVALALSAIGIFGVMAYMVSQRTREIGIRLAVGAQPRDVLRIVIGHGLKLTLSGISLGIAGALALGRFLSSLLYGVPPYDPATLIGVSLLLIVVALAACYLPLRRAMRIDPMVALRHE